MPDNDSIACFGGFILLGGAPAKDQMLLGGAKNVGGLLLGGACFGMSCYLGGLIDGGCAWCRPHGTANCCRHLRILLAMHSC